MRKIVFSGILFASLFVAPINSKASLFSNGSYLRKSLRVVGGVGLLSLFSDRMISYAKKEKSIDLLDLVVAIYMCYNGFKILEREV